jgi:hypothetical protein
MDLRGRNRRASEQTFSKVRKISILIAQRRDPLVYLDDVNTLPRKLFIGEDAKHDPGSSTAADSHHEAAAVGYGGSSFLGNRLRDRSRRGFFIGEHFNVHRLSG